MTLWPYVPHGDEEDKNKRRILHDQDKCSGGVCYREIVASA